LEVPAIDGHHVERVDQFGRPHERRLRKVYLVLSDHGVHTSWATLHEQLSTSHQVQTIVLPATDGQTLRIRKASTPKAIYREIYRTLQIPHEIMKPVRTWALTESR